jgi:hypothetical protein
MRPAVVLAGAALALTASTAAAERTAPTCEADAAGLKTLSDPQRNLVHLRPKATTIAAIDRLAHPRPTPTTRATGFQRHAWRVRGQIVEYRLERDGDIELALYDGKHSYLTATMPHPRCLSARTRAREAIVRARALLEGLCGPARPAWRELGAVAVVDGVGYWGARHAELRPVTGLRLVAGCA